MNLYMASSSTIVQKKVCPIQNMVWFESNLPLHAKETPLHEPEDKNAILHLKLELAYDTYC